MTDFWSILRISVNLIYMVGLIFVMSNFKCTGKTARAAYAGVVGSAFVINAALYLLFGRPVMMQFFAVTSAVPCLAALLILTKDRFPQLFFNFFTAVNALYLVSVIGLWVSQGTLIWLDTLIRAVLYSVILILFHRYFSGPYHFIAENMVRGWWVISVMPLLFFAMVMYLGMYPTLQHDNFPAVVMLYVVLCLLYVVIYQVFQNTFDRLQQEQLARQMAAHFEMQRQSAEQIRQIRHDMRHLINNLVVLLRDGKPNEALLFAEQFSENVITASTEQWCQNQTLNAILGYYLEQAKSEGVAVDAQLDIPDELDVDIMELSTMFANALENALNACRSQPAGQARRLKLTAVTEPQFAVEIANTFSGEVRFGRDGLPVTDLPGHGFGTRSIASYAKKHGAALHCKVEGGLFRLYLLLNAPPPQTGDGTER